MDLLGTRQRQQLYEPQPPVRPPSRLTSHHFRQPCDETTRQHRSVPFRLRRTDGHRLGRHSIPTPAARIGLPSPSRPASFHAATTIIDGWQPRFHSLLDAGCAVVGRRLDSLQAVVLPNALNPAATRRQIPPSDHCSKT